MIPTVYIDFLISYMVGAAFAMLSMRQFRSNPTMSFFNIYLKNALFMGGVFMMTGLYLFIFQTDWSVMYVFDVSGLKESVALRTLVGFMVVIGYELSVAFGFWVTQAFIQLRHTFFAYFFLGVCALNFVTLAILTGDRLLHVGDYKTYHGLEPGGRLFFKDPKIMIELAVISVVFILAAIFFGKQSMPISKKPPANEAKFPSESASATISSESPAKTS